MHHPFPSLPADYALVDPSPETQEVAKANLFAFSDEGRARNATLEGAENLVAVTRIPRTRECLGWMRFTGEELLRRVPTKLLPPPIEVARVKRFIDNHATYTAVVYEFVETGPDDPDAAQAVLDFLWRVGFAHVPVTKADNWEGGVLLDHSDIVHCNGHG
ncbi:hypothetical protein BKA56DRAFT_491548 [Ilyonectria sp. MPI-CAGE-AT-0026]|nr:hypothetical protein BKA56DRAFT_491548 [Ilyonectria sp. MPI-CAGE-AT-0026]